VSGVADRKPPRIDGDDRRVLGALLQFQRESLATKIDGVDEWDARRALVSSGTSLLWLARHMACAESLWLEVRFAGDEPTVPDDTVGPDDTVAAALDAYRAVWSRSDAIVAGADLDDRCRAPAAVATPDGADPPTLRWVLAHLLQETARHAGHADILREQIDGTTGR
jgi:hypothetical protein